MKNARSLSVNKIEDPEFVVERDLGFTWVFSSAFKKAL